MLVVNDTSYSAEVGIVNVFLFSFSSFFLTNLLYNGNTLALVTQMGSCRSVKGLGTAQVDCEVRFQCLNGSPYSMGTEGTLAVGSQVHSTEGQ